MTTFLFDVLVSFCDQESLKIQRLLRMPEELGTNKSCAATENSGSKELWFGHALPYDLLADGLSKSKQWTYGYPYEHQRDQQEDSRWVRLVWEMMPGPSGPDPETSN